MTYIYQTAPRFHPACKCASKSDLIGCLRRSVGRPADRAPASGWLNVYLYASLWRVIKKNSADCRCLLECLLISLGQPAEVKGHVFPYLSMFAYLWAVVAFPFNILARCAVFIPFIQLVQLQQRRRSLIGVHLWKLKDFALHSSTDSRFICQKTCTICPCVIQSRNSVCWWLV